MNPTAPGWASARNVARRWRCRQSESKGHHSASVQPETVAIELEGAVEVQHGECDYVNARIHRPPLVRVGVT